MKGKSKLVAVERVCVRFLVDWGGWFMVRSGASGAIFA